MSIEASFSASEGKFPLAEIFSKFPSGQIEMDRVVPTNDVIIPYFWLREVDATEITMEGIDHPGLTDITVIDDMNGGAFVRIDWDFAYESVLTAIMETGVTLISAIGKEGTWNFQIRGEEQQDVSDFHSYCRENGIPLELTELHALSPLHSDQDIDLTEAQYEALTLAYTEGYFDSPRKVSQEEVADELGITRQALASRLQRGTRRLIASTLVGPEE